MTTAGAHRLLQRCDGADGRSRTWERDSGLEVDSWLRNYYYLTLNLVIVKASASFTPPKVLSAGLWSLELGGILSGQPSYEA